MIQRYSIYADGYYSIDESENGLYCLYADAEKWVKEEIAMLKEKAKEDEREIKRLKVLLFLQR